MGVLDEGGQNTQTFSYKLNNYWNVIYSMVTVISNTVLHVGKLTERIDLKTSDHLEEKKFFLSVR